MVCVTERQDSPSCPIMGKLRLLHTRVKLKGLSLMKAKIFRFFYKYLSPICLILIVKAISGYLPYTSSINIMAAYLVLNYYVFLSNLSFGKGRSKKKTIYYWLDKLDGSETFLKTLFLFEKNKDINYNLNFVYEKFMSITGKDKRKMKLLRGYFRTLNEEGPLDLFFKTFLAIIVAVIVWGINRGYFLDLSKVKDDITSLGINPEFITGLNLMTFGLQGVLFLGIIISDYFSSKKRTKIIIEILDVCIDELD